MKSILLLTLALSSLAEAGTIIPFERETPRVSEYSFVTSLSEESQHFRSSYGGDDMDNLYYRGQTLLNIGPNDIVTTFPDSIDFPNREFFFITDDRAKRDTYLWITDYIGTGMTSDYFESILMFFPRVSQQYMEEVGDEIHVTLATGEEVIFFKKYKTLLRGVLAERPLDFNQDRNQRKFAEIQYSGKGMILRSNAKGRDPRLAKDVQVLKGNQKPCVIPGNVFWTQADYPKFRFVNDEDVYAVIQDRCGKSYLPEM